MNSAATKPPGRPRPVVLAILDGFGERADHDHNAVRLAHTPALDALYDRYPHGLIGTSGPDVGLPPGQMGNSEVGHLNFGAGRIATMDITRIDNAVRDGALAGNEVLKSLFTAIRKQSGRIHLLGLLSDGGVHSSIEHLLALVDLAHDFEIEPIVHAFLDGRDVAPGSAPRYLEVLERHLGGKGYVATVSGRYYGMDRDHRWDRIERVYRAIVTGEGERFPTAAAGIDASYRAGKSDEFVVPFVVGAYRGTNPADGALHTNFRPDRARELTCALTAQSFDGFARSESGSSPFARYACMTTYDVSLDLPAAFEKVAYPDVFPEIIAARGMTQLRCAETEKYAHVTYFFNGGREAPFEGEERILIPSPKDVATYDERPEMSAQAVADAVVSAIESDKFDFILVNFANPDMIGHTGILGAAIEAVQAVDRAIGRVVDAVRARQGAILVTADHGNCELMQDPVTHQPHTAHTLNPVPFLYVNDREANVSIRSGGRICDAAPTLLGIMGLEQPAAMTGRDLIER